MQYEEASKLNVKCQYCLKVTQALADFCTRCINICASTRVLLQAGSSRDVLKAESHVVCCFYLCRRYVLGMSDGIDDLGTLRWQLVVSLLAAWIFIFLALCKGVKSSGKAS